MSQQIKPTYKGTNISKINEILYDTRYFNHVEVYEFQDPQYGDSDVRIKFNNKSVIHTGFGIGHFQRSKSFTERLADEGFVIKNIQTHIEDDGTISLVLYTTAPTKTGFNLNEFNHVMLDNGKITDLGGIMN